MLDGHILDVCCMPPFKRWRKMLRVTLRDLFCTVLNDPRRIHNSKFSSFFLVRSISKSLIFHLENNAFFAWLCADIIKKSYASRGLITSTTKTHHLKLTALPLPPQNPITLN